MDHFVGMKNGSHAPLNESTSRGSSAKPANEVPPRQEHTHVPVMVCQLTNLEPRSQKWVPIQTPITGYDFSEPLPT